MDLKKYQSDFVKVLKNTKFDFRGLEVTRERFFEKLFNRLEGEISNEKIFIIGNGASCSMASHFATDFLKNCGIDAESLNGGALLTCFGNDYSFEDAYAEIVNKKMLKGGLLIAISSSGNSENIIRAVKQVVIRCPTLTLSGFSSENRLKNLGADFNIYCPAQTYGMVESAHAYWMHAIIDYYIERWM